MGAAGGGAGACVRSALRSCSLGRPGRTRVFPLPSRAAPSWGLPCALCCHPPLWEELNFPAVSAMSGEDQLFKVDGRSELGRAFTLEAPRQGSGCLGESSLRAGGPAASSSLPSQSWSAQAAIKKYQTGSEGGTSKQNFIFSQGWMLRVQNQVQHGLALVRTLFLAETAAILLYANMTSSAC